MRLERRHGKADEPDEINDAGDLDGPLAKSVAVEPLLDLGCESVALCAIERFAEELGDSRIGVERCERGEIVSAPRAQVKPPGAKGVSGYHGTSRSRSAPEGYSAASVSTGVVKDPTVSSAGRWAEGFASAL